MPNIWGMPRSHHVGHLLKRCIVGLNQDPGCANTGSFENLRRWQRHWRYDDQLAAWPQCGDGTSWVLTLGVEIEDRIHVRGDVFEPFVVMIGHVIGAHASD